MSKTTADLDTRLSDAIYQRHKQIRQIEEAELKKHHEIFARSLQKGQSAIEQCLEQHQETLSQISVDLRLTIAIRDDEINHYQKQTEKMDTIKDTMTKILEQTTALPAYYEKRLTQHWATIKWYLPLIATTYITGLVIMTLGITLVPTIATWLRGII